MTISRHYMYATLICKMDTIIFTSLGFQISNDYIELIFDSMLFILFTTSTSSITTGMCRFCFLVVDLVSYRYDDVSYYYDAVLLNVFLNYVDHYGDEITINDYIDFTGQVVHYIFHDVDCGDELYVVD